MTLSGVTSLRKEERKDELKLEGMSQEWSRAFPDQYLCIFPVYILEGLFIGFGHTPFYSYSPWLFHLISWWISLVLESNRKRKRKRNGR